MAWTRPKATKRSECRSVMRMTRQKLLLRSLSRLFEKVIFTKDCWIWSGGKFADGYGGFCVGSKNERVHRIVYEIKNGPIPKGMLVCHRCDNPICVKPSHLFLSNNAGNLADMARKDRSTFGERNARWKHPGMVVRLIREEYSERKTTLKELSVKYKIPRSTVHAMVTKLIWRKL